MPECKDDKDKKDKKDKNDKSAPAPAAKAPSSDSTSPPEFKDLGRSAGHLFTKSFNYGTFAVKCTSKTANGVEIQANGVNHHDSGAMVGELCMKKKWEDNGLALDLTASSERTVKAKISSENQPLKGCKIISETDFLLQSCNMASSLAAAYKNTNVNTSLKAELLGPNILGALVIGYGNTFAGCQVVFDRSQVNVNKVDLAVSKVFPDSSITLAVARFCEFAGSTYHKVNESVEVGTLFNWNTGTKLCKIGGVVKYKFDSDTFLKAKLNSQFEIGLSYKQKIREGISVTASTLVYGNRLSEGCHKFGLGVKLEL